MNKNTILVSTLILIILIIYIILPFVPVNECGHTKGVTNKAVKCSCLGIKHTPSSMRTFDGTTRYSCLGHCFNCQIIEYEDTLREEMRKATIEEIRKREEMNKTKTSTE